MGKALFTLFMVITMTAYMTVKMDMSITEEKRNIYEDAIQAATQIATAEVMDTSDVNMSYDGIERDASDIAIDLDSLKKFRIELKRSLDSLQRGTTPEVTNINVPLIGIATNEYIVGKTYGSDEVTYGEDSDEGEFLLPAGYTYYMKDNSVAAELKNKVWNFTMGNEILMEGDVYESNGTEVINKESKVAYDMKPFLRKYGFSEMNEFSDFIVTECMETYLNTYTGQNYNSTSENLQQGLEFDLGKSNYSSNRKAYGKKASVMSGPGIFAVIDLYTGSGSDKKLYQRMISFGGSEWVSVAGQVSE